MNSTKKSSWATTRNLKSRAGGAERQDSERSYRWSAILPLRNFDQKKVHYSSTFRIWTCRSREVRSYPMRGKISAKWRAQVTTRVSINLLKSMYWKSYREHRHTRAGSEVLSKVNVTKLVVQPQNYRPVRLVRRKNNPNKKILIYISCISHQHSLSSYNPSCLLN